MADELLLGSNTFPGNRRAEGSPVLRKAMASSLGRVKLINPCVGTCENLQNPENFRELSDLSNPYSRIKKTPPWLLKNETLCLDVLQTNSVPKEELPELSL